MALDVSKPKDYKRAWRGGIDLTRKITVCDACHCASCWHGQFMCDQAEGAGTVDIPLSTLMQQRLENEEYWFSNPATNVIDREALESFRHNYPEATSKSEGEQHRG